MNSFVIAVLLLGAAAAPASDKIDCKSDNLNQMQLDSCAGQAFKDADTKLNALYKSLIAKYDSPNRAKLKAAERAWLAYRDAECDYETNNSAGGTINSMLVTQCKTAKTEARFKELDAQLHCGDGDLSCNAP